MRHGNGSWRRVRRWTMWVWAWLGACLCAMGQGEMGMLTWHGDPIPEELETMYVRGLNYLVKTQESSGAWGGDGSQPGVVGLAVLAMLAHGDDPNAGPYAEAIRKGVDFILRAANAENGYLGSTMYNHGFATLALAEAYGSVNDPRIGPALEKAVRFILTVQARNPMGAWRYGPDSQDADTTVTGAQMVALLAARNAGISVPDKAIEKGLRFLRQCQGGDGGFGYTANDGSSPPRVAIGVTVFALARLKNSQEFKGGYRNLQQIAFTETGYMHYYLYYAAQAHFHADMERWNVWKEEIRKFLAGRQNGDGSWTGQHGQVFSTAAALLAMALEYRFLPIYER